MSYFRQDSWDRKVVLLLDEFSCLYESENAIRNDCLSAIRGLKHTINYAVQCVIAAGTFSIVHLNLSNVADSVQSPYFTIDETRELFREFQSDFSITIDDAIVDDIWTKSNGLVAQFFCV